ncbi:MAG: DUF4349 domain-containing protein [Planctomycetota bacterium]
MTEEQLERELAAMTDMPETTDPTEGDATAETPELWRAALDQARSGRGGRRIPGRRRFDLYQPLKPAQMLIIGVLALGMIGVLIVPNLGRARYSRPADARQSDSALAPSVSVGETLDGMLRPSETAAASDRGGGREFSPRSGRPGVHAANDAARPAQSLALARGSDESASADEGEGETAADAVADALAISEMQPALLPDTPLLERSADLSLSAADVDEAAARVSDLVDATIGEFVTLTRVAGAGPSRRAAVSLRVRSTRFEGVLDRIRAFGRIVELEVSSVDLSAEARSVRDQLGLAIEIERDVLARHERLETPQSFETTRTRREMTEARRAVDTLERRLRELTDRADWSTIRVLLVTAVPEAETAEDPGFGSRLGIAAREGLGSLQAFVIWATRVALVAGPIALLAGLIAWPVWRLASRFSGRPPAEPGERPRSVAER